MEVLDGFVSRCLFPPILRASTPVFKLPLPCRGCLFRRLSLVYAFVPLVFVCMFWIYFYLITICLLFYSFSTILNSCDFLEEIFFDFSFPEAFEPELLPDYSDKQFAVLGEALFFDNSRDQFDLAEAFFFPLFFPSLSIGLSVSQTSMVLVLECLFIPGTSEGLLGLMTPYRAVDPPPTASFYFLDVKPGTLAFLAL